MIEPRQRNVAFLVAACFFMQNLDGTIVVTAAPRIGADLHVSSIQISLVITAYLITFAVLIPLGGWLVSRFGTRVIFLSSILIFTLASVACALSVSFWMLVGMRVLQGIGGAMMTPTGRIVALANVEKRDILRIMSFIVWPGLIAPVVAPLAGGLIVSANIAHLSWRPIFLINLPLGLIAYLVGLRLMPSAERAERQRLDTFGLGLLAAGLGGLTYSAHLLSITTPGGISGAFVAGSFAFLAAAIWHLLRTPFPLVGLRVFAIASFRSANAGITLFVLVVQSVPFLLPLLFENVFGWGPIKAGAVVMCVFAGNIGIKPATTYLFNTFGFRRVLVAATLGVTISMAVIGLFRVTTPVILMIVVVFFNGVVRSTGFTGYMSLSYSDVPEVQMRDANVLAATVQQVATGLAIATGAVALHLGGVITAALRPHPSAVSSYMATFSLLALIALVTCVMALRLPANAGDSVRAAHVGRDEDAELAAAATH